MENDMFLIATIFILFFINMFFTAAIADKLLKHEKKLKPKIPIDHEFLKAVDDGVKQIEAERIKKRNETKEKLFCFHCEIDTIVSNHNGNKYCDNCGLIHTNKYI